MTQMEQDGNGNIFCRVRSHYNELSRTQKRIADYFLEHADTACFQSLKEIAAAAKTTEATILRFCNRMECDGFLQFKRELQDYVKVWISPNEKISSAVRKAENDGNVLERLIRQEKKCLEATYQHMLQESLSVFVEEIRKAEHVKIVGHYISEAVAIYLTIRLRQAGIAAERIDVQNIYEVEHAVSQAGEKDLFILISFPYYSTETMALVDYLGTTKIKMICLTDRYSSPIAVNAAAVLVCSTDHEIFYNSITAAISMVNLIVSALVLVEPERFDRQRTKKDQFNQYFLEKERKYREEKEEKLRKEYAEKNLFIKI